MATFDDFKLSSALQNALADLGFVHPTPIQEKAFSLIRSGKNVVGISQTGTGKTLAFTLPLLQDMKYSTQDTPRILMLVPTRELVTQLVEEIQKFSKYMTLRTIGVYGGTNINTQKQAVAEGVDIVVATPGRLYDLVIDGALKLKTVKKVVIDEVDVMLDLGFRFQLKNIFELLPEARQNILFSATMTQEVDELIGAYFFRPKKIAIAVSGTPLDSITQVKYPVENFYTKINLLKYLLKDAETFSKTLVFVSGKKNADRIFEKLEEEYGSTVAVIHSNKTQNYRFHAIENFESGESRILIATDVMARGIDLNQITHVINFNVPKFPENYMHRIGRTGRANQKGNSILLYADYEITEVLQIEELMKMEIEELEFPDGVEISNQLTPDERPENYNYKNANRNRNTKLAESGPSFHEKKLKNQKVNLGGKYKREIKKKYKKPKTRSGKKRK